QMTLAQSIAGAGGLLREAYPSHVPIVRGTLTEPKVPTIDFNAVIHGQAPDVVLEPKDIVYVPHAPYRVITRYVDLILDTFARTVGVNEGARAISNNPAAATVNVPVGPL